MKIFFLNIQLIIILKLCLLCRVKSHGRMNEPPARNVMWRYGFNVPANYDDFGLNCGGVGQQHQSNGGKCGICGDNYSTKNGIRDHEVGGQYATGIIGRTYSPGQIIDVNILLSANHKGYFEFKICPVYDEKSEVKQECLDKNLMMINGKDMKYNVMQDDRSIDLKVKLPDNLTCKHCVMQWRYRAGNNWGQENGRSGLGLGPQEEFWNCADIAITKNHDSNSNPATFPPPQPEPQAQIQQTSTSQPSTTDMKIEQLTSAIYIQKSMEPNYNEDLGQIACALRGVEPSLNILYQKIKVCLDRCKKDITESCPEECFCVWTVEAKS